MKKPATLPRFSKKRFFSLNQIPASFFLTQVIIQTLILLFWFGLAAPVFSH